MKFRFSNRTIREFDVRDAFPLTPPTFSVELPQSREFADGAANCERLYVRYVAANLEKHWWAFYQRVLSDLLWASEAVLTAQVG